MSAILDDDEDVLAGNTGERTVVVNPRELALRAIEDGRIREFEQESGVKVPAQPVVDEDMDADDVAAEQERARLQAVADGKAAAASRPAPADDDQLQRQVQDVAPTVIDNFDNVVVKRKVNGVEELVPLADVMRTHQKTAAADQRLEEATRLLREAEARAKAVPEAPAPAATPPKDEAADIAAELTTALFAGDEEKARELLRQGLSRPSIPTPVPVPSVDVLAEQVEQQIAVKGALREFQRDYSRLVDDPELATLSDMRINHQRPQKHNGIRGQIPVAGDGSAQRIYRGRCAHVLWLESQRPHPSRGATCRQNTQGCEAGRSAGGATHEI